MCGQFEVKISLSCAFQLRWFIRTRCVAQVCWNFSLTDVVVIEVLHWKKEEKNPWWNVRIEIGDRDGEATSYGNRKNFIPFTRSIWQGPRILGENNQRGTDLHKTVGLYLVNAFEVGFFLLGFTRSTRPRNLKSFFDNFDTMYEYAELFIGRRIKELEENSWEPSKETERDRAGSGQRKADEGWPGRKFYLYPAYILFSLLSLEDRKKT